MRDLLIFIALCLAISFSSASEMKIEKLASGEYQILVGSKGIKDIRAYSVSKNHVFEEEGRTIYILEVNSGGMACPVELLIVEVRGSEFSYSDLFGSCSDKFELSYINEIVYISFSSYFNVLHLDELTPEERREINGLPDKVFSWDGQKLGGL